MSSNLPLHDVHREVVGPGDLSAQSSFNNVYYLDPTREIRWILPPKCASSSIKCAAGLTRYVSRAQFLAHDWFTVGAIRQPRDRLESAFATACRDLSPIAERYAKHHANSHIRPQAPAFRGIGIDHWLRFWRLSDDWDALRARFGLPELPHLNPRTHALERIDWDLVAPRYAQDVQLCRA